MSLLHYIVFEGSACYIFIFPEGSQHGAGPAAKLRIHLLQIPVSSLALSDSDGSGGEIWGGRGTLVEIKERSCP